MYLQSLGQIAEGTVRTQNGVTYVYRYGRWVRPQQGEDLSQAPVYQPTAKAPTPCSKEGAVLSYRRRVDNGQVTDVAATVCVGGQQQIINGLEEYSVTQTRYAGRNTTPLAECLAAGVPLQYLAECSSKANFYKRVEPIKSYINKLVTEGKMTAPGEMPPAAPPAASPGLPMPLLLIGGAAALGAVLLLRKRS